MRDARPWQWTVSALTSCCSTRRATAPSRLSSVCRTRTWSASCMFLAIRRHWRATPAIWCTCWVSPRGRRRHGHVPAHQPCRIHGAVHPPMTRAEPKYHIKVDVPSQTLIVHDPQGKEIMRFRSRHRAQRGRGAAWQRTNAARRTLYSRKNRRRPAGEYGFHLAPANGRNLLAGAAYRISGARLDTHAHPLALRPGTRQKPLGRGRHPAPLHLHPRLPGRRPDG